MGVLGCMGYMRCIGTDGVPGVQGHGGRPSPSPAGRCACLLHHLVMETEISSGFRQDGRRTCAVRIPGVVGWFLGGNSQIHPAGSASEKPLAKAALGEEVLSRSDGFEPVPWALACHQTSCAFPGEIPRLSLL